MRPKASNVLNYRQIEAHWLEGDLEEMCNMLWSCRSPSTGNGYKAVQKETKGGLAFLQLLNELFNFLCTLGIELFFIWREFLQ